MPQNPVVADGFTSFNSGASHSLSGAGGIIMIKPSSSSGTITIGGLNSPSSVAIPIYGVSQSILLYYSAESTSYYFLSGTYYNTSTTTLYHIQARCDASFTVSGMTHNYKAIKFN